MSQLKVYLNIHNRHKKRHEFIVVETDCILFIIRSFKSFFFYFKMFSGNFRKCSTTADCEVHNISSRGLPVDVHCADDAGRGYKTCFCVSTLKEADKDGSCETHCMVHFSYFNFLCFCLSHACFVAITSSMQ